MKLFTFLWHGCDIYICVYIVCILYIECDYFLVDRTPNILNKDQLADKKPKNDMSPVSLKHEFDPTGEVYFNKKYYHLLNVCVREGGGILK